MTDDFTHSRHLDTWRPLSWSSIFFGAFLALAISAALHILGVGVTASSVNANGNATDAMMTIGGVTGIWFLVATAVSVFIGAFVASSLGHSVTNGRAAAYGLGVWALTTLVSVAVIGPAMVSGAKSAFNTAGTVVDRTASAVGAAGNGITQNAPANLIDRMQRTLLGTSSGQVDQDAVQQVTMLIGQRIYQGNFTPEQKDQLTNAVAKAANIPVDDARRRVNEAQNTIDNTIQQASNQLRQAAEATRTALAGSAYWIFGSMLIGFIAALFGARFGETDPNSLPTFARFSHRNRLVEAH